MPTSKTFRSFIGYYYMVLSILIPIVRSANFPWENFQETSTSTCDAPECREMAQDLKHCMKKIVNPCEDFYEYVCGNWKKDSQLESYIGYRDVESVLEYNIYKQLKSILEKPVKSNDDVDAMKAKQLYQHCMKLPYLEKVDATVLRDHMKKYGFWGIPPKEQKSAKFWLTIHNYYLSISGVSAFFQIDLRMPQDGVVPYISLQRSPTPFGTLVHTYEWSEEQRKSYFEFLEKVINTVAGDEASKFSNTLQDDLRDVFKFRLSLRKIHLSKVDPAISTRFTVKHLSEWYKGGKGCPESGHGIIDWLNVFRAFHKDDQYLSVDEETVIHVHNEDYLYELCYIMTRTRLRTIANHIHLYFMERQIALNPASKRLLSHSVAQGLVSSGKIKYVAPQWFNCIFTHNMKDVLGALYDKSHLTETTIKETNYMIEYIQEVIQFQIDSVKWLKESAKKDTIARLHNIKFVIGYPKEKNSGISKELIKKMMDYSTRPYAFYDLKQNVIYISAGFFQQPVFDKNLPFTVTYAALGTLIAHEISHMFDIQVLTCGALRDSWGKKSTKRFIENVECFNDLYSKQPVKELEIKTLSKTKVNALLTRDENIADVMGLQFAYNAYKKMVWTRKGMCPMLPEFENVSCDKLFFIAYARTYCSDIPTEMIIKRLGYSKHSLSRLRVNVPVSSMPQFARAFKCEVNTPMNPIEKCDIWK